MRDAQDAAGNAQRGLLHFLDARSHPSIAAFLLSFLHGTLLAISFPPIGASIASAVCLIPLFVVSQRTSNLLRSGVFVAIGSLPAWLYLHLWLMNVSPVGLPFLAIYLALYQSAFVIVAALFLRRRSPAIAHALGLGVLWVGLETLRGSVLFHGYPWYFIAHSLIDLPIVPQSASIWGASGISLLLAVSQAGFVVGLRRWPSRSLASLVVGVTALILLIAGGAFGRSASPSGDQSLEIGVVQTTVELGRKITWSREEKLRDFEEFLLLTREVAASTPVPDVILWPETMFPGYALNQEALEYARADGLTIDGVPATHFSDILFAEQERLGIPLIIGALARDNPRLVLLDDGALALESDGFYNSVFLIEDGGDSVQRYDKLHLTPFGEVMPYISAIEWLERALLIIGAGGMTFDLDAGQSRALLELSRAEGDSVFIATPVCFEATMPALCRRLVFEHGRRRANLIGAVTNDAWFGASPGLRERHLALARWRAIELGTPIARAANTGISTFIASDGSLIEPRETGRYPSQAKSGWITTSVPLPSFDEVTVYGRVGDLAGWFAMVTSGFLAIWICVDRMKIKIATAANQDAGEEKNVGE